MATKVPSAATEYHRKRLAAKVEAVNAANAYHNKIQPVLIDYFRQFVGQRILKVDGDLMFRCRPVQHWDSIVPFPPSNVSWHYTKGGYGLSWQISAYGTIEDTHQALYHHTGVLVGELDGGILTGVVKPEVLRIDYTVEEINRKREARDEIKRMLDEADSALHPFGIRDT